MKRTEPKLLGDIIRESLQRDGIETRFDEQRAAYMWGDIVGPGVNRYTTRRYIERGVLHVFLSSAALKQELTFMRQSIIKALNEAVGSGVVKDIVLH
ncbi:MAG: DUF721 domain-containing protein [Bacteroides sp.]|nr:DUF721 domain-containing protein [Lachnospiraceae bacterium]MCM1331099.1 DUF721 domain-containing protein [Bacteroides sp.]MCM1389114.1 DUF721 domain-containing protein [Bacteroides sp.]